MKRDPRQSGFTLIETLVSFVILSGALIMSFAILSQTLRATAREEDLQAASQELQRRIADLRREPRLSSGARSGQLPGGRWDVVITPLASPEDAPSPIAPFRVTGSFTPRENPAARRVLVETIIVSGRQ